MKKVSKNITPTASHHAFRVCMSREVTRVQMQKLLNHPVGFGSRNNLYIHLLTHINTSTATHIVDKTYEKYLTQYVCVLFTYL